MAKRHNLKLYLIITVGILVLLPILLYSWYRLFGGDYSVGLPRGYTLIRVYSGAVLIANPSHEIIISPNIDKYEVIGNIVIGHVSREGLPSNEAADSVPGFFILDVRNGTIQQGLTEQAWLLALNKLGITERPNLHKPSRFDRDHE